MYSVRIFYRSKLQFQLDNWILFRSCWSCPALSMSVEQRLQTAVSGFWIFLIITFHCLFGKQLLCDVSSGLEDSLGWDTTPCNLSGGRLLRSSWNHFWSVGEYGEWEEGLWAHLPCAGRYRVLNCGCHWTPYLIKSGDVSSFAVTALVVMLHSVSIIIGKLARLYLSNDVF